MLKPSLEARLSMVDASFVERKPWKAWREASESQRPLVRFRLRQARGTCFLRNGKVLCCYDSDML